MNRDLALMVEMTASRAGVSLGNLMPLLKEFGDESADQPVKLAIASAIYEIGLIADQIYEQYPDLKTQADARRDRYGRSYF
jgi:hypothetical protein